MVDIEKQIAFWRKGAAEDWEVALDLARIKRNRHSLFFAHLAIEKTLKGLICKSSQNLAPRIHSLLRLAEMVDLSFSEDQLAFLARFDRYQIEGRYPGVLTSDPDMDTTSGSVGMELATMSGKKTT
jgi:HEPN domain-containing protein